MSMTLTITEKHRAPVILEVSHSGIGRPTLNSLLTLVSDSSDSAAAAALSETNAAASAAAAATSENNAAASEAAAAASEAAAAASAEAASSGELYESLAQEWAENPENVAVTGEPGMYSAKHHSAKAAASAGAAGTSETNAAASESNAAASESNAATYAASVTDALIWRGNWDASLGSFPPTPTGPETADMYRVDTAGTMSGAQADITAAAGDYLHWNTTDDVWIHLANSGGVAVTSVNSRSGEVVLTAADVGLDQVPNYPATDSVVDGSSVKLATAAATKSAFDAASAKLDAASYTAADVLAKVLTVDGAASGLDADLLDGQHGSFYQNADNLSSGTVPAARLTSASTTVAGIVQLDDSTSSTSTTLAATANAVKSAFDAASAKLDAASYTASDVLAKLVTVDGAGSGLDADLLDGVQGSAYAKVGSDNTFTSELILSHAAPKLRWVETDAAVDQKVTRILADSGQFNIRLYSDDLTGYKKAYQLNRSGTSPDEHLFYIGDTTKFRVDSTGAFVDGQTMWHAGNDGAGSGLDADLLDGLHASSFLRSDSTSTLTSTVTVASNAKFVFSHATDPSASAEIQTSGDFMRLRMGGTATYRGFQVSDYDSLTVELHRSDASTFMKGLMVEGESQLLLKKPGTYSSLIQRNDGSNFYFLLSDPSSTFSTTWNALRPLAFSLTSGLLESMNGQTFEGGTAVAGSLTLDGAPVMTSTGATGAANLPAGTTAQRPGSPATGQLRYNTTTAGFEGYTGSDWGEIGGDETAAVTVATGDITLLDTSPVYQFIDTNGATRNVTLPAITDGKAHVFAIQNIGSHNLSILNPDTSTLWADLEPSVYTVSMVYAGGIWRVL